MYISRCREQTPIFAKMVQNFLLRKALLPHCGNYVNLLSPFFFYKNFVKATFLPFLQKKLRKNWFHEIFFGENECFVFPHCALLKERFSVKTIFRIFEETFNNRSIQMRRFERKRKKAIFSVKTSKNQCYQLRSWILKVLVRWFNVICFKLEWIFHYKLITLWKNQKRAKLWNTELFTHRYTRPSSKMALMPGPSSHRPVSEHFGFPGIPRIFGTRFSGGNRRFFRRSGIADIDFTDKPF